MLIKYSCRHLFKILRNQCLKDLVGEVYHVNYDKFDSPIYGCTSYLYLADAKDRAKKEPKLLTAEDKIKLFFDPEFTLHTMICDKKSTSEGLEYFGHRSLEGCKYNTQIIDAQVSKKNQIVVGDIGSGVGRALLDLKGKYRNKIETHGITFEQGLGEYPVDFQHYCLAEYLPKEFEGKFDVIFSNMAFRYFLFQNIAMRNVVKALHKDGIANIHFSYEASSGNLDLNHHFSSYYLETTGKKTHDSAMEILVAKEMQKIKSLGEKGLIEWNCDVNFERNGNQGNLMICKKEFFDYEEETDNL